MTGDLSKATRKGSLGAFLGFLMVLVVIYGVLVVIEKAVEVLRLLWR